MTPGTTTEQEALSILRQEGLVSFCDPFDREVEGGTRGLICERTLIISFARSSEIVDVIGYGPSRPTTLAEVVAKYGSPSFVGVQQDGIPEVIRSVAVLFFDGLNARLTFPTIDGQSYPIGRSSHIDNVAYFSGPTYHEMTAAFVIPWNGYGDYVQISSP